MFYFAYGSNMKHQQMEKRCPSAHFLCCAYLENYKFVYDGKSKDRKGAVANVIDSDGDIVRGGLFEISKDNLAVLDGYEGYPDSYGRDELDVKDDNNNLYKAIVYFRVGEKLGKPTREYRQVIIEGAQDCRLPEEYIKSFL